MPTPTRKKISASAQAVTSRRKENLLCHNKSNESLNSMRFTEDFSFPTISHDVEKTSKTTLMSPPITTDDSLGEHESKDIANSSQFDEENPIDDEMPPRDELVGSPDMRSLKDFFSSPIVEPPTPWPMSSVIWTNAENWFLKDSRFTNEFLSPRIAQVTPNAPKSTRISPRIMKKSSRDKNSLEYSNAIDECAKLKELSSDVQNSMLRRNVTTRHDILDKSSHASPRESLVIIGEVITLGDSSDDENQISVDMGKGAANESLDEAEYNKYLQLKAKYEGKRKPAFYSK